MNVLAKTKKFFLGLVKTIDRKAIIHPLFKLFLKDWNTLLSSSNESSYDTLLKDMEAKHPFGAISYYIGTWLTLWKEKIVSF